MIKMRSYEDAFDRKKYFIYDSFYPSSKYPDHDICGT